MKHEPDTPAKQAKRTAKAISLKKPRFYYPVLTELLREFGSLDKLKDKQILELGPGGNLHLAEKLHTLSKFQAVGLSQFVHSQFDWLVEKDIYHYLAAQKEETFDVIYSRRVMEQNSFEPGLMVQQEFYHKLIREGADKTEMVEYQGSKLNLIRNYIEIQKVLKLNGIVISHVGNRRLAAFHDQHLHKLGFELVKTYPIRWNGQMWVFRKICQKIDYKV